MPRSTATAIWDGNLKDGGGHFNAGSGAFRGTYTFGTRFEGDTGTNPEELIAAALASCFSMALASGLEKAGTPATRVATMATCTIEMVEGAPKITTVRLEVRGKVPGATPDGFLNAAQAAKDNCPVSKALKGNVAVELDAKLES